MAAPDHIVQRAAHPRPIAREALSRRFAPQSRAFRYRNERVMRANVVDRSAIASRTGSLCRHRCRVYRRRRRMRANTPMSELTAMETGSYRNGTDALRSSPLAAPQGPGAPATSSLL